jgi:hypothetical protein
MLMNLDSHFHRLLRLLIALIGLLPLSAVAAPPLPPTNDQILAAARTAVEKFKPSLDTPEAKQTQGFAADEDFKNLSFGTPFEQKLLRQDWLETRDTKKLAELLAVTSVWYVPVRSRGKVACLVAVRQHDDGSWSEDRLGMVELARAWDALAQAWPETKGYHPVLVVFPARQQFFFTVPEAAPENLSRLDQFRPDAASPGIYRTLTPAATTLAALRS